MAGTSYTRQSSLTDGDTITASLFNDEYNQLVNAFAYAASGTTGHQHDGGAGEGGNIEIIGDADFKNKIVVDSTNNRWSVFVEVGGTAVEQVRIEDGVVYPVTDSDVDLGTDAARFKAAYIDSITATTSLTLGTSITVSSILDEDDMASNSATALATQQSIKAYVDSQVTAQDLDVTDGTTSISIDLDSEALSVLGGTGIDSTASGNGVTLAIDSTVATLTGSQTLTNKTLTSPDVNTPDIDGGTIDGTIIGGTTAAAGSFTTVGATGNITVGGTVDGRDVATDGTKLDGIEAGATADQTDAEIRAAIEAATDSNVFTDADHSKLNAIEALADVTDTANVTAAGALMDSELTNITAVKALNQGVATTDSPSFVGLTASGEITANGGIALGDNDKATFGNDDDLQIYHSGTHSFIDDAGQGNLYVRGNSIQMGKYTGEIGLKVQADDAVTLYYDNVEKLSTTATGIDVTGTVTAGSLNIGTTADAYSAVYLTSSTTGESELRMGDTDTDAGSISYTNVNDTMTFRAAAAPRLTINSTGIDVTGTATMDGLTVDGATTTNIDGSNYTFSGTDYDVHLLVGSAGGGVRLGEDSVTHNSVIGTTGVNDLDIVTYNGSAWGKRARFDNNGDISFYEDTGTTAKFFWDASAESLGIGTSSPSASYSIDAAKGIRSSGAAPNFTLQETDASNQTWLMASYGGDFAIRDTTVAGTAYPFKIEAATPSNTLYLDSTGSVGIGTSSPSEYNAAGNSLVIANDAAGMTLASSPTGSGHLLFADSTSGTGAYAGFIRYDHTTNSMRFAAGSGTERMRIDSSGNVGIGTSSPQAKLDVAAVSNFSTSYNTFTGDGLHIQCLSLIHI